MVALADTTPPLSPEDQHLLERYIHHNENLTLLAAELSLLPLAEGGGRGVGSQLPGTAPKSTTPSPIHPLTPSRTHPSPLSLLIWTAKPHIAPYITLYRTHITHLDKREGIEVLKSLIRTVQDPTEKRRAATTLLRALANQLHPTRPKSEPSGASRRSPKNTDLIDAADDELDDADLDDSLDDEDSENDSGLRTQDSGPLAPPPSIPDAYRQGELTTPSDCPLPDPLRKPEDVIHAALHAIQNPETPVADSGPITLYNLSGIVENRTKADFDEFKRNTLFHWIKDAWHFKSSDEFPPLHYETTSMGPRARTVVPLILRNGTAVKMRFTVHQPNSGLFTGCWLLKYFICDPPQPPPPNTS